MTQAIPNIQTYMTPSPHTIGAEQNLNTAEETMGEHGIRHLPVLDGGKLVGILSDRDIQLIKSFPHLNLQQVKVAEAMSLDPYVAESNTPIDKVTNEMARLRYGSAVITEDGKVVGIFTTVDALKLIKDLLAK